MLKPGGFSWNYNNLRLRWTGKIIIISCMVGLILSSCFIFHYFHEVVAFSSLSPSQCQCKYGRYSTSEGSIMMDTIENQATNTTVTTQSDDHYRNKFESLSVKDTIAAIGKLYIPRYDEHLSPLSCRNQLPFAVLVINSAAKNFDRRRGIRQTWANGNEFVHRFHLRNVWKVVFIVGKTGDANIDQQINIEAKVNRDLLIINTLDNHRSLTNKTLLGMYWASQICPAKFYYKGDDDVWVNKWRLLDFFLKLSMDANVNVDNCWIGMVSEGNSEPVRDIDSKYYVSYKDFSGDRFPKFCSGFSYIMTRQTATKIIASIPFVKKIPGIDDVYIGLLANRTGIQPQGNFRFHLRTYDGSDIKFNSKMLYKSISEHGILTSAQMMELQQLAKTMYSNICRYGKLI